MSAVLSRKARMEWCSPAGDVDVYATKLRRERQEPVRAEEEDFEVIPD
jgi:hypothetical protein